MNPLVFLAVVLLLINGSYYGWQYIHETGFQPMVHNAHDALEHIWSNEYFPWVMLGLFVYYIVRSAVRDNRNYQSYPTASEYLNRYFSGKMSAPESFGQRAGTHVDTPPV